MPNPSQDKVQVLLDGFKAAYGRIAPRAADSLNDIAVFSEQKAEELLLLLGDPNYDQAESAALDQIMLHGAVNLTNTADVTDAESRATVLAVLRFGISFLAAA